MNEGRLPARDPALFLNEGGATGMHDSVKRLKVQLVGAALTVVVSAVALSATTYAWFAANNRVHANTSSISAQANGMVLQIAKGKDVNHDGSDKQTTASSMGHEISPSSTNDAQSWLVPKSWQGTDVSSYQKANTDASGKYTLTSGADSYYAYVAADYTLYTVTNTGIADVYLDGTNPVTIKPSDNGTEEWFNKIKRSLRVGIVINDELKVVYAPVEPSTTEHGNDAFSTTGWSCVAAEGTATQAPIYAHVAGTNLIDQNGGNWAATGSGGSYSKPAGANPRAIAKNVGYNGTNMKIVIWMEGTDSDCQNWSEQDKNIAAPTFDVTVSLVGIVPDGK